MALSKDLLRALRRAGLQLLAWIGLLLVIRAALIILHVSAR